MKFHVIFQTSVLILLCSVTTTSRPPETSTSLSDPENIDLLKTTRPDKSEVKNQTEEENSGKIFQVYPSRLIQSIDDNGDMQTHHEVETTDNHQKIDIVSGYLQSVDSDATDPRHDAPVAESKNTPSEVTLDNTTYHLSDEELKAFTKLRQRYDFQNSSSVCELNMLRCPILTKFKGTKGDEGPQGVQGPTGSTGFCRTPECSSPPTIFIKGDEGPAGKCGGSCPSVTGPRGRKGPQGYRGDIGRIHFDVVWNHVQNTFNDWSAMLLKNDKIDESITKLKRMKRSLDIDPEKEIRNYVHTKTKESSSLENRALGLIILKTLEEMKTHGGKFSVGSIVAVPLNTNNNLSAVPPEMGMFIKTNLAVNQWNRVPVIFGKEVAYGIPPKISPLHSHYQATELFLPSSKLQLVLAYYPQSFNGGEFLGWYGADGLCRSLGEQRLGIPGFRVFLADQNLPVERILPWRYSHVPVVNLAGDTLFKDLKDFLYGLPPISNEPIYDLNGMPYMDDQNNRYFWFGAGREYSCSYWSSNNTFDLGLVWTMERQRRRIRTSYTQCDSSNYLLCYKLMHRTLRSKDQH